MKQIYKSTKCVAKQNYQENKTFAQFTLHKLLWLKLFSHFTLHMLWPDKQTNNHEIKNLFLTCHNKFLQKLALYRF